jgi:hypothetical protein
VDRPGTIINLADRAYASLRAHVPTPHDPLANPGRAGTVLIRAGPAPAHLDIYWCGAETNFISFSRTVRHASLVR